MTSPPKQITIRNPSPVLANKLKALAQARGESLNSTILFLLERSVGMDAREDWLKRWATWTDDDRREFDEALQAQRVIDWEMWE